MTDVGLGEILFTKQAAAQIGPQVVLCRPGCQRPVSGQLLSVSSRGCAVCIQTPDRRTSGKGPRLSYICSQLILNGLQNVKKSCFLEHG